MSNTAGYRRTWKFVLQRALVHPKLGISLRSSEFIRACVNDRNEEMGDSTGIYATALVTAP